MKKPNFSFLVLLILFVFFEQSESGLTEQIKPLKYKVTEKKDISYANTPRMVWRILLDVKDIPPEAQIRRTALDIWENGNKHWKEFTVFMYLPEMDTEDMAYVAAEFTNSGIRKLIIENVALLGTKWVKQEEKPVENKIDVRPKDTMKKKQYIFVNLGVTRIQPRKLKIVVATNFPDGTVLHVSVLRDFREAGESESRVGDIWQEKIEVKGGKFEREVEVDDIRWQVVSTVAWASPEIEISVFMTPLSQPYKILEIIGEKAELIAGQGLSKTEFGFYVFEVKKKMGIPFERAR